MLTIQFKLTYKIGKILFTVNYKKTRGDYLWKEINTLQFLS
jgi:hypothetical protein